MPNEVKLLPCDNETAHPEYLYVLACKESLDIEDWQPNRDIWSDLCDTALKLIDDATRPTTVVTDEVVERARMVALRCASLAAKTPVVGEPDPDWWERQSALGDACDKIHELLASMPTVVTGEQPDI